MAASPGHRGTSDQNSGRHTRHSVNQFAMRYKEIPPAEPLRRFVRCFWVMRGPRAHVAAPERVLPDGSVELVFNLSDRFEHYRDGDGAVRQPQELVVGELLSPMLIAPTGTVDLVGVRFRPGGARPFLGPPLAELTGRSCDAADVCRPLAAATTALGEADATGARVRVLERRLLSLLRSDPPVDDRVLAGVARIESMGGRISVDRLARELNLSSRQLERRFAIAVGLSPKLLCRIIRFQRIFGALRSGLSDGWSALALRCGYYDQAHLIRDFRQFAGQSPTEFVADRNLLAKLFTGLDV